MKPAPGIRFAIVAALAAVGAAAADDGDPALNNLPHSFLRASAARGSADGIDGAVAIVESSSSPVDARHYPDAGGRVLQAEQTLSTSTGSSNNKYGIMFDVRALADVTINKITWYPIHMTGETSIDVNIYTASGGYSAIATNSAAWTLIEQETISFTAWQPYTLAFTTGVGISNGSTQAFYLFPTTYRGSNGVNSAASTGTVSNSHLEILPGKAHDRDGSSQEFASKYLVDANLYGGITYELGLPPSQSPTTGSPTGSPTTGSPSKSPSSSPSGSPTTGSPSQSPTTGSPSKSPSSSPSGSPTTGSPSQSPTTGSPSESPSSSPSGSPTTASPSTSPTTGSPSTSPTTGAPSKPPTGMKNPTFKPTPSPTQNSHWYPNWRDQTNTCKNDGNEPGYMKIYGNYYESSLKACCDKYFSWDIITCNGESAPVPLGYYPNWLASETKCLASDDSTDRDLIPAYMRDQNPEEWVEGDVESCCGRYYNYAYNECVSLTSGSSATEAGTNNWYVDWSIRKCVKDCNDPADGDCGGLAKRWDELFGSASECCGARLWDVKRSECTL